MNAVITYKEISDFIEKEFKVRPKFTTVDEKAFEVSNNIYPDINFFYPKEYVEYDSKVHLYNWYFPKGGAFLKDQLAFLQKAHEVNNLIPFAMNNADGNEDSFEYACFIIDGAGNNRIMTIRPFSTHKSFFQEEYRDIKDWFENGIQ